MSVERIDVFRYLDYRKFLGEYYKRRKRESSVFSFRYFARRCGLRSPNHLKRVIDGERNLSEETAIKYAEAIGLEGDAGLYFCELVRLDQAKSGKERSAAYRRLTQYRGYRKAQSLDASHDRYHSEWYVSAIREMLTLAEFREDPKWIAAQLIPPISAKQAADALKTLDALGMTQHDESGALERSDPIVSTGPETSGLHIVHYHAAMMDKAIQSIDTVPRTRRDISGVTVCLPANMIPTLKERIREFRKELLAMEASPGYGEEVVQLAIQMFPLTKPQKQT